MLVASIATEAVELYSAYLDDSAPAYYSTSTGSLGTHQLLQRHAEAVVMDYHLQRLRLVFGSTGLDFTCTGLDFTCTRTTSMMDEMRAELRQFLENWRAPINLGIPL
jgi:hypothetical protein